MESYEKWEDRYYNKKIINVKECYKDCLEVLKKLQIDVKEGEYTQHEYELFKMDVLSYYPDEQDNEYTKSISEKGVLPHELQNIINRIDFIASKRHI